MLDLFTSVEDYGDVLEVRVTPKAFTNRVKVDVDSNGKKIIKVYVTTAPEDGKANMAVLKLLSKELGVAKSKLKIIKGEKTKDKLIQICKG